MVTYKFKFKLGSHLKDKVTDFEGIAMSTSRHVNGCIQYEIQPKIDKDKKIPDAYWIDQSQLELIKENLYPEEKENLEGGRKRSHPGA